MRFTTLAVFCALTPLVAAPALAQSNTNSDSGSSSDQSADHQHASIARSLRADLQKAGFTNIRIMPEAFIVRATNPEGQKVVMRISPDTITEITALPTPGGNGGNGGEENGSNK